MFYYAYITLLLLGCSLICINGDIVAQASQFSVVDVEVITAVIDLNDIRSYRAGVASFQEQASVLTKIIPQIDLRHFSIVISSKNAATTTNLESPTSTSNPSSSSSSTLGINLSIVTNPRIIPRIHSAEEECALGPACWLWDYLRRSGTYTIVLIVILVYFPGFPLCIMSRDV